jgi:hypothetical protein
MLKSILAVNKPDITQFKFGNVKTQYVLKYNLLIIMKHKRIFFNRNK